MSSGQGSSGFLLSCFERVEAQRFVDDGLLLFEMQRSGGKKGLATLCIGGGMGVAMCLERA